MAALMVAAGITAASAVLGGIGQRKGNKAAERAQREQADLFRQTTAETARRLERGQERVLGEAKAGVYASGIHMSGSSEAYVQDMQTEQARELAWLKDAGEKKARAIEKGASAQAQAGAWQNLGQVAGGIGRAVGGYYGGGVR